MTRSIGLVNFAQGGVYLFFAAELGARWAPAGWMLGLAAALQALAGLSLLSQRAQERVVPVAAGRHLASRMPNASFVELPGHGVQGDVPSP